MNIKIVGPGCKNCKALYEITKAVIKDNELSIDVEHITDIQKIVTLGVIKSPGLIINDKIVAQGKRLSERDVLKLIQLNK